MFRFDLSGVLETGFVASLPSLDINAMTRDWLINLHDWGQIGLAQAFRGTEGDEADGEAGFEVRGTCSAWAGRVPSADMVAVG